MVAAEWGTGQVFWSMLWFFMFFIWIWLLVTIFADIFRSGDLSGWAKAAWSVFVIVLPYLGVFTYLIARGRKMSEHAADEARIRDEMMRSYVKDVVASTPSGTSGSPEVDSLAKLADLRANGLIDDAEYAQLKARITPPTTPSATTVSAG
jgi:Short C-terminal domain